MTTTDLPPSAEHIAQVIAAWNANGEPACSLCLYEENVLCPHEVSGLANHLVRNRTQVQDAQVKALVEALQNLTNIVAEREQGNHDLDEEIAAADAALKSYQEAHHEPA